MTREGRLLQIREQRFRVLQQAQTIATIGIKGPGGGAAYVTPRYLYAQGYRVIPVSPKLEKLFDEKAYAVVSAIADPVDIVQIFRRAEAVPGHVDEILAMQPPPRVVWMQNGISSPESAARLTAAGIDVVQNQCMKSDHELMRSLSGR